MASRVNGQLAASKPSKIPANATAPANPQRTYLLRVLVGVVASGGAVAIGMTHYLDAEDGQGFASHSLYLVDEGPLHSPRSTARSYLGFILPTPRHFLERLNEIDKFSLMERPEDPGFTGT